jgi:hypothetical protein
MSDEVAGGVEGSDGDAEMSDTIDTVIVQSRKRSAVHEEDQEDKQQDEGSDEDTKEHGKDKRSMKKQKSM